MAEYIKRSDMRAVLERASINPRFADEPPAAEVAPVVHAHVVINWLGDCHCSNCRESIDSTGRYCNLCGAVLDEPEQKAVF